MLGSQVQVLLVGFCFSGLMVQVGGAPRREQLTEILQQDFMKDQGPTLLLLLRFMPELTAQRGEMLRVLEEEELGGGREKLRRRRPRFTHRQRKAGCRNFFWKSFTAC